MRLRPPAPPPPVSPVSIKSHVSHAPVKTAAPGVAKAPLVKVCGITRVGDVADCLRLGVHYIGINRYAPSPRCVQANDLAALIAAVPVGRRVYVDVNPGLPELHDAQTAGFDFFQIHFDPLAVDENRLRLWKNAVGSERLWLAPRLKGGVPIPQHAFAYARTFLIDGYSPGAFGGTGKTSDWAGVCALKSLHRDKSWVVAGGLGPDNIVEAVRASHADVVDLNSGVESSPGIKNPELLARAMARLSREIGVRS